MADAAERFCGRFYRCEHNRSLLVLVGESGCGKTHVAVGIHKWALSAAFRAFEDGRGRTWARRVPSLTFARWPEAAQEIRERNLSSIPDLCDEDLLLLDDVGAEHDPFKDVASTLCQVLSRREEKFTVITSNVPPETWPQRFDTRITDRLLRNSEVVNLFGLPTYAARQN